MTSKLWHSLVCFGISLGASGPGCAGRTDADEAFGSGPDDDAGLEDAGDPFCDTAWPTTKGSPPAPACIDTRGECVDAGLPSRCMTLIAPFHCGDPPHATICVDGAWQCAPGTVPYSECRCWGRLAAGEVCTETGPLPAD